MTSHAPTTTDTDADAASSEEQRAMIRPGLERIATLLKGTQYPWKAIHVAGTNGKGTTCAFLSAMLRRGGVRTGVFTSPHLVDRWDCIGVDGAVVSQRVFLAAEERVRRLDEERQSNASSFELLAATAFEVFTSERVDVAVVECGMGGRDDATNIMQECAESLATVITSIDLDHQEFLGTSRAEIAGHKAGIMRPGVPCIVGTTDSDALGTIEQHAAKLNAPVWRVPSSDEQVLRDLESWGVNRALSSQTADAEMRSNAWCSLKTMEVVWPKLGPILNISTLNQTIAHVPSDLAPALSDAQVPGRLQTINLGSLLKNPQEQDVPALLDGAHNPAAWQRLRRHVDTRLRGTNHAEALTWVLALSASKPADQCIDSLLPENTPDNVVVVEFGPVDGMPWVRPCPASNFAAQIQKLRPGASVHTFEEAQTLQAALQFAATLPSSGIVVAGSLYLVSDVLRLLRAHAPTD